MNQCDQFSWIFKDSLRDALYSCLYSWTSCFGWPCNASSILTPIRQKASFTSMGMPLESRKQKFTFWPHFPQKGNFRAIFDGTILAHIARDFTAAVYRPIRSIHEHLTPLKVACWIRKSTHIEIFGEFLSRSRSTINSAHAHQYKPPNRQFQAKTPNMRSIKLKLEYQKLELLYY